MKLNANYRDLLRLLNANCVRYVVVGGYALAMHGAPRFTGDIDLFIDCDPGNAQRLIEALREFGLPLSDADAAAFTEPDMVVQFGRPPQRIDFITTIDAVSFEEAWASRVSHDADGLPVSVIGCAELIRNKEATGRPRDIADVQALLKKDKATE